jgi:hypothetical protein
MGKPSEKNLGERAKKWLFAFIKFNIIGFIVFLSEPPSLASPSALLGPGHG